MPATILIPITVVSGGTPLRHAGHDRDHGNRGAWRQFASVGSFRQQPFTLPGGLNLRAAVLGWAPGVSAHSQLDPAVGNVPVAMGTWLSSLD